MSLAELIRKRKRRRAQRNRQTKKWQATKKAGHGKAAKRHARAVRKLTALIRREKADLRGPRIITAKEQGIEPDGIWGPLGTPMNITGHYTAGPTDSDLNRCIELNQSYDDYHRSLGWGGIGYHYCIARTGEILGLRPVVQKGAHTGNHNSNNVGIMMHGTTGDKATKKQKDSLKWLLENAHTDKMPSAHRSPVPLQDLPRRGHNDWPGHESNSCPGSFKSTYINGGSK